MNRAWSNFLSQPIGRLEVPRNVDVTIALPDTRNFYHGHIYSRTRLWHLSASLSFLSCRSRRLGSGTRRFYYHSRYRLNKAFDHACGTS